MLVCSGGGGGGSGGQKNQDHDPDPDPKPGSSRSGSSSRNNVWGRFPFPLEMMDHLFLHVGTLRGLSAWHDALAKNDPAKKIIRKHTGRCIIDLVPLDFMDIDTILKCRKVCRDWKNLVDSKLEERMLTKVTKERSNREWTPTLSIGDVDIKKNLFVTPMFLKHGARRRIPGKKVKLSPMFTRWIGVQVNFLEGMDEWEELVKGFGRNIWCFELTATIRFQWELEEFINRLGVYLCHLPNLRSLTVTLEGEPFYITSHIEHEFADFPDEIDLPSLPHLEDLRLCSILDSYVTIQILRKYGPQVKSLAFANDFNHLRVAMKTPAIKAWPIQRLDLSRAMIELPEQFRCHHHDNQGASRFPMLLQFLENFRNTLTDLEICLGGFFQFPEIPNLSKTLLRWDKSRLPRLESLTLYNCEVRDIDFIMAWSDSLKTFEIKMSIVGKKGKINMNRWRRGVYNSNIWKLMPVLQTVIETELQNNGSVKSDFYRRRIYEQKLLERKQRHENSTPVRLKKYVQAKCSSVVSTLLFWRK